MTKVAGSLILPTIAAAPSSPVAGQVYYDTGTNTPWVYNGTIWIPMSAPKMTSQAFSSGPPSSPADGDIWNALDVDGANNGITWRFRYHASSTSAYKWEYIGGPPAIRADGSRTTRTVGTANSWQTTPGLTTFTSSRGGDYIFEVGAGLASAVSGGSLFISIIGLEPLAHLFNNTANVSLQLSLSAKGYVQGASASQTWTHQMFVDNISNSIADPWFTILPIRVS